MLDVEKIKKGLDICTLLDAGDCTCCPYFENTHCNALLVSDAAEYIESLEERIAIMQESMEALEKRNEPIKPDSIMTTSAGIPMAHCPNCNEPINQYRHPKFCGACGQAVKWE